MRCEGKLVLVTGAQQGIGQAVALRFAQEGADGALNFLYDQPAAEAGADVTVFLATDDARHSIGQLMHVHGGDYLA